MVQLSGPLKAKPRLIKSVGKNPFREVSSRLDDKRFLALHRSSLVCSQNLTTGCFAAATDDDDDDIII
jgi:hypothetical protein